MYNIIAVMPQCATHPPTRTSEPRISHRAENLPQLVLSLCPLQPWVWNTWTPPLAAPPAVCDLLSATKFAVPTNTGSTVQLSTPAPEAAVIPALTYEHAKNLRVWKTYTNTDKFCKQTLLSLVPELYYLTLKKKYTAYARVTCLTLLTHFRSE